MIVEEIMKKNVITLSKENSIADALKLMKDKKIRHLPIIDDDQRLIGLVTDRDIRDATPSIFDTDAYKTGLQNPLKMIMKTNIITGHPLDFIEEISAILYENRIGCLPIMSNHKLVGIVTGTDLLHTLVEMTGVRQPGSQIEVKVQNKPGILAEVTAVLYQRNVNIQSVLVYPDRKNENCKIIVLRVETLNPLSVIEDLRITGHEVLWPNLPGTSL